MAQSADDCEQVRQLYARYAVTIDEGKVDEWMKCFTDDASIEHPFFGSHRGLAGLREFADKYLKSLNGAQPRHLITNVLMELGEERGTGSCYSIYFTSRHGHSELEGIGGYRDELRKQNGRWLIARREVFVDAGPSALPGTGGHGEEGLRRHW
jgi:3-phenylpropionate/cinnamic acid dioxygenase small subunit